MSLVQQLRTLYRGYLVSCLKGFNKKLKLGTRDISKERNLRSLSNNKPQNYPNKSYDFKNSLLGNGVCGRKVDNFSSISVDDKSNKFSVADV